MWTDKWFTVFICFFQSLDRFVFQSQIMPSPLWRGSCRCPCGQAGGSIVTPVQYSRLDIVVIYYNCFIFSSACSVHMEWIAYRSYTSLNGFEIPKLWLALGVDSISVWCVCVFWSDLGNRILLIICVQAPSSLGFGGGGGFKSNSHFSRYFLKQRGTEGRQI